jgi:hypothetical protein
MPASTAEAVKQIDAVLARFEEVEKQYLKRFSDGKDWINAPEEVSAEVQALLRGTLDRLSPSGDKAGRDAVAGIPEGPEYASVRLRLLAGTLRALKADYLAGRLQTLREMIRSDVFSDFLEMAEYLLKDEGLKDPAAVIAGGVLEQHIRKLCENRGILTTWVDNKGNTVPKKLDRMNADLAKAGVYGGNDQKQVTAWADLRNDAAHGQWSNYVADQVTLMVQGVRGFLARNPA